MEYLKSTVLELGFHILGKLGNIEGKKASNLIVLCACRDPFRFRIWVLSCEAPASCWWLVA